MNNNINSENKENLSEKAFAPNSRRAKAGSYSTVITIILLAVLIVINLIVNALPSRFTVLDTSVSDMFTLSETSEKFIKNLKEDVTIYFIAQNGDADTELKTFTERYPGLNSKVKLKYVDPIKEPTFLDKYSASGLSDQSIIVESQKRYKVIDNNELYYCYNENVGRFDRTDTYTMYLLAYQGLSYTEYFDGESMITNAIEYVTAESIPKVYILSGHGEQGFSEYFLNAMTSYNIAYEVLDTAIGSSDIPSDAACIAIVNPLRDISSDEAEKLIAYLRSGGHLFLATDYDDTGMTNLMKVMEYYGAGAIEGMVNEGNSNNYYQNIQYYIYPEISSDNTITSMLVQSNYRVIIPSAHAIKLLDSKRDTVKAESLFTTSGSAFIKADGKDDSAAGSYILGLQLTEETAAGTAKLIWFSSADMLTDSFSSSVSDGNYLYTLFSLAWMAGTHQSTLKEINGVSVDAPTLVVTAANARFWSVMFIAVIPLAIFVPGLVIWMKRRKR